VDIVSAAVTSGDSVIGAPRFAFGAGLCALLLAGAVGCGPSPLAHAQASADALARAVLDAIARADDTALRALAVNEEEFRTHIWPGLPTARPERNVPFSYVWGDLRQKSDSSLRSMLVAHEGKRHDFVKVAFAGDVSQYGGFRVHRDAVFVVRDAAGVQKDLRLCGSFVEKDGGWKVLSYVIDD
jgi:hypothetical protein